MYWGGEGQESQWPKKECQSQIKPEKRLGQRSRKFMSYKQKDKRMSRALSSHYQESFQD